MPNYYYSKFFLFFFFLSFQSSLTQLESDFGVPIYTDPDCYQRCISGEDTDPCLVALHRPVAASDAFRDLEVVISRDQRSVVVSNDLFARHIDVSDPQNPSLIGIFVGTGGFDSAVFGQEDSELLIISDDIFRVSLTLPGNSSFYTDFNVTSVDGTPESLCNLPSVLPGTGFVGFGAPTNAWTNFTAIGNQLTVNPDFVSIANPSVDINAISFDDGTIYILTGNSEPGGDSDFQAFAYPSRAAGNILEIAHDIIDLDSSPERRIACVGGSDRVTLVDITDPMNPLMLPSVDVDNAISDVDLYRSNPNGPIDRMVVVAQNLVINYDISNLEEGPLFARQFNVTDFIDIATRSANQSAPFLGMIRALEITLDDIEFSDSGQIMYGSLEDAGLSIFCTGNFLQANGEAPSSSRIGVIVGAVIGALCGLCLCLAIPLIAFFGLRFRNQKKNEKFEEATELKYQMKMLNNVEIGKEIGKGNFGIVYHGTWNEVEVALKAVHSANTQELVREISLMRQLEHPNVLRCFGVSELVVNSEKTLYIVTEYMDKGSLLDLLHNDLDLTFEDLTKITRQVALGMLYLHRENIIHRDLACRNLLVSGPSSNYVVKVADFGLSRQTDYYSSSTKHIPIRWSPPEAIEFHKFSQASDVWSFGVVVWEIFTRGGVPYAALSNSEVATAVKEGKRLQKPEGIPSQFESILETCWDLDPKNRPTFEAICKTTGDPTHRSTVPRLSIPVQPLPSQTELGVSVYN